MGHVQNGCTRWLTHVKWASTATTSTLCEGENVPEGRPNTTRKALPGRFEKPVPTLYCFGFHPWKKGYVRRYVAPFAERVVFTRRTFRMRSPRGQSALLVWGMRDDPALQRHARRRGMPIWRMEDGFLRSVGLGSDRTVPASLVLDKQGIYYDPTQPSDLETILQEGGFSAEELSRAATLREAIVRLGVSKYNVGDRSVRLPEAPADKRVVLVPGQVEDDASIRLGTTDVNTNAELLRLAREKRPDAFIIFKPHPDVVSGNRLGAVPDHIARRYADAVVVDAPLPACLAIAHEVHTMTSLVGFEALMRGLTVSAYGLPFYAGWGLTDDRESHPRRTRHLTLDELVAGALIRYPLYMHPETMRPASAEAIAGYLQAQIAKGGGRPVRMGWAERKLMKAWNAVKGVLSVR